MLEDLNEMTMLTLEEGKFIYEQIKELPEIGSMLDIGTGMGHSVVMFSKVKPKWVIYTIDIYSSYKDIRWDEKISIANVESTTIYLRERGVKNAIQIIGDSKELPLNIPLNFIFIDGDHSYDGVKKDFERFSPFLVKGGIIIFHDANMDEPKKFLEEIGAEIKQTLGIWRKK
jgi:predicted O-methyltransferase YrrM